MKQKLPWLLLVVGLFAGFVMGAISSTFFLNKIAAKHLSSGALVEGIRAYGMLSEIRAGRTSNAVDQLEMDLDSSVISASVILEERLGDKETASLKNLLVKVANYRQRFPRTNESTEVQEMLDAALKSATQADELQKEKK